MVNPIFDAFQPNQQNNSQPLTKENIANQFTNFVDNFMKNSGGVSPEQLGPMFVQQGIQNGQISQSQFDNFRQIANMITGLNK